MLLDISKLSALRSSARALLGHDLNKADTMAFLLDPLFDMLGYSHPALIRRAVQSPAHPVVFDYVLYPEGKPSVAVQVFPLGKLLPVRPSTTVFSAAASLGCRWLWATDGLDLVIYPTSLMQPSHQHEELRLSLLSDSPLYGWEELIISQFTSASAPSNDLGNLLDFSQTVLAELTEPTSKTILQLGKQIRKTFGRRVDPVYLVAIIKWFLLPSNQRGSHLYFPFDASPEPSLNTKRLKRQVPQTRFRKGSLLLKPDGTRVTIDDLLRVGLINVGDVLHLRVGRDQGTGIVRQGGIEVDGILYPSATSAARAITQSTINPWDYWTHRGRTLSDIRQDFLRELHQARH